MKAFVTGGSGFIGRSLISQLINRGYDVVALARSAASSSMIQSLGATAVPGDITDKESMRAAMVDSDVVFHTAVWYEIGSRDRTSAEAINVDGTRNVLTLAVELGIPKIIYTSTMAIFGDTHGKIVDETYIAAGPFDTEYERTKWLAHYKVAVPLIRNGAPITIVMPGMVYGPGDTSFLSYLMRLFYRGLPALLGPDTVFCYVHVDDAACGLILAAERGRAGETYILSGPAVPLDEMMDFWANLTARPAPKTALANPRIRALAPIVGVVGNHVALPPIVTDEALRMMGRTTIATSVKAERELGWRTRPLQSGMLETLRWVAETQPDPTVKPETVLVALAGAGVALGTVWLIRRLRSKR
ncbi:MAG: NAD-dependent epimerase/dehydratase family protein [Anaerolineae bacterium]|nr:NAD-dependent epimerase/dehydratase family protein [Anaerolineae bacterium]MCO5198465.1 NAD-dependent epimerase/dehydratase family protein [Anaerolineae bacterium]MCO5205917.1 NAD-dependent epimerase/dehydratase family protein [Anaerolineae bacterium]